MTDLVFLLLIFFIIMSLMSEPALPVDLPSGQGETMESSVVNVGVTENNMYIFPENDNKTYTFEEIKPLLEGKMKENAEKNIKISGDRNADYEFVFNLIALSKQKGWRPVLVFK